MTQRGGDLAAVRAVLAGRSSVLVGHSGVGKSTLVNALVPEAHREVGHRQRGHRPRPAHLDLGVHAAAARRRGGWIIDTPGIRSFGLAHIDPDRLIGAFPDLEAETDVCPRGCSHGEGEPECGLDEAIAAGTLDAPRVESFRRLLAGA